ncbi:MAG: tyrosine transporter [Simkaniaceae bacterium]|nr:tyrosine transporter [Simkaniaceae bacterium]
MKTHGQQFARVLSGTFLIAGTSVGAGMLGIPLVTSKAGFWPAMGATIVVWLFMLLTGLLLLEACLWRPSSESFLSISRHYLGHGGRVVTGIFFAFLYYCIMIAYFAAGAPLFAGLFGIEGPLSYLIFGLVFGAVVAIGPKSIDRVNFILTIAMCLTWVLLIGEGSRLVRIERLSHASITHALFATPILFSAFGYHNVVPSLCSYLGRNVFTLRLSIFFGTTLPLLVYILWQWLIIGALSPEALEQTLSVGAPVTDALRDVAHRPIIHQLGRFFALFAIITSTLGVSFSMVDFIGDGLKARRTGTSRIGLTLLTFGPPFVFALINPAIFDRALSIAGGFGESFLNGILPVALVWAGRYNYKELSQHPVAGGKPLLVLLFLISVAVICIEAYHLMFI